jgi:hypothetical protein
MRHIISLLQTADGKVRRRAEIVYSPGFLASFGTISLLQTAYGKVRRTAEIDFSPGFHATSRNVSETFQRKLHTWCVFGIILDLLLRLLSKFIILAFWRNLDILYIHCFFIKVDFSEQFCENAKSNRSNLQPSINLLFITVGFQLERHLSNRNPFFHCGFEIKKGEFRVMETRRRSVSASAFV